MRLQVCCTPPFFCTTTSTPGTSTLSLHDALPILRDRGDAPAPRREGLHHRRAGHGRHSHPGRPRDGRSEEHTSELQSLTNLVCRLLLEKKNSCPSRPSER